MSSIPSNIARVSGNLVSSLLRNNVNRTNVDLLQVQEQIATGLRVTRPSDDASVVASINSLRRVLEQTDQTLTNLTQAQGNLDTADQSLADVSAILLEAQSIASSQVGIGSDTDTRANQAEVVAAQITQLLEIANRDLRGVHLFGGKNADVPPFEDFAGGVRYNGSREDLVADIGLGGAFGVNTNGEFAFGALSSRVEGTINLDPSLRTTTRLVDVDGAVGRGVTLGTVTVNVDGSPTDVDLRGSDTAQDIIDRIGDAIGGPGIGSLAVSNNGLLLTAQPGHVITIADIADGTVAEDLGLRKTADASASGVPVDAAVTDIGTHLTLTTQLSAFGPTVDFTGGIRIQNGGFDVTVDTTGITTVEQLINRVKIADVGVRFEIAPDKQRLRIVNEVSGTELSISNAAGGTTATDLGIRSFDTTTPLSDLNFGNGITTVAGDDLQIHLQDGTDVFVDLSSAVTVGDVIAAINTAAGGSLTAGLNTSGNGIALTDNTVGPDQFSANNAGLSLAADDLGLRQTSAGSTIAGEDVGKVRVESVFTHLMMLRDGLLSDDARLITEAGGKIQNDVRTVATARASIGVRSQRISQEITRVEDQSLNNRSLLSDLRDTDLNEAISRFTQLQQQLQANLLSGQQVLSLSLLDFLR